LTYFDVLLTIDKYYRFP